MKGNPESRVQADKVTVPILEETATIKKRRATTGRVRVVAHTETFEEIARATLKGEAVEVTRVSRNLPVDGPVPVTRTEGDVTIVPILEEVLVVETRLVLKEELHFRRHQTSETVELPVTLRRQRAKIERSGNSRPR